MYYDLILHLDSAEEAMLRLLLRNAANYLKGLPDQKFQLDVVANGGGVKLFTKEHTEMHSIASPLHEKGVRFKICANALADNGISPDSLWPECEIVPAGIVEIVRLQREGFAYIKP